MEVVLELLEHIVEAESRCLSIELVANGRSLLAIHDDAGPLVEGGNYVIDGTRYIIGTGNHQGSWNLRS